MKKVKVIQLNSYERVDPRKLDNGGTVDYHMNDTNNKFFNKIESAYLASPTNTSIIDSFVNYIIGDGLIDSNGNSVDKYISKDDVFSAVFDYKLQGQCALEVNYDYEGKMAKMYQVPVKFLGPNKEKYNDDRPEGYWYCADWSNTSVNKPVFIPAFGKGDGFEKEILYIRRNDKINHVFSLPDWFSGLQYCFMEEEMSNFFLTHIMNSFSVATIVNINQGSSGTDEAKEEAADAFYNQLTGTNGARLLISTNDSKENATTVENVEITDAYSKFEFVSRESQSKIMQSHKVNDPSLFSIVSASGFSSTSDQMITSLKILYKNQIKPIRETLLHSLQKVFDEAGVMGVEFLDFEELRKEEVPTKEEVEKILPSDSTSDVEVDQKKNFNLKKWRSNSVSSNVDRMMYNDDIKQLVIKFNDGSTYTYFDVQPERFVAVSQGYAICKTSGFNKYGIWIKGKSPSVGAAVHKYLDGLSYSKGGSLS
jgi:hypothetical protein